MTMGELKTVEYARYFGKWNDGRWAGLSKHDE